MTKDHQLDLNQWRDCSTEFYEGYDYDYEFIGITDLQINIARTKPSLGFFNELPPGLREITKAILNIRSKKYNCLPLCITAALNPATRNAIRKSKYIKNLFEDNEYLFDYLRKIQNKWTNIYGFIDLHII